MHVPVFPPESHREFLNLQDVQPQGIRSAGNREADAPFGQCASCTPQPHLETLSHPPGFPTFPAGEEKRLEQREEAAAASPDLTQPADLPQNPMNLLELGRRAFLPGVPRVAPAAAPGPAAGPQPARHLPKQLLGQQGVENLPGTRGRFPNPS